MPLTRPDRGKLKTRIEIVPNRAEVRKMPRVKMLEAEQSVGDCSSLMASCLESSDVLGCSIGMIPHFIDCLVGGKETLVANVPCGKDSEGAYYMPYSVYLDWIRCTFEQSGGYAECDEFTTKDEEGREITTKITCVCPKDKSWDGKGCKCPESHPYDKLEMEQSGAKMDGECCAAALCGEGGVYDCGDDRCECAPGFFDDGMGGCTSEACSPGEGGGTGCARGACCESIGECILDEGQWDGLMYPSAPRTRPECEAQNGLWIITDENTCPSSGHCKLSICDKNRVYGGSAPNQFVISECDPYCLASKCDLACQEADAGMCGGQWVFDSCDNRGDPPTCTCACAPI